MNAETQVPGSEALPSPKPSTEELLRKAEVLLKEARQELIVLRGQVSTMRPTVEAYETLRQVLGMVPDRRPMIGGSSEDVVYRIDQALGLDDEEPYRRSLLSSVGAPNQAPPRRIR